jgi:plasmid stabilization system protein ParE
MRRVRLTPEAEDVLAAQIGFLVDRGAVAPAQALKMRVEMFLSKTLAQFPRNGRHISERELWETWIPRTKLVVWYRFTDLELVVVAVWHTSQDRAAGC